MLTLRVEEALTDIKKTRYWLAKKTGIAYGSIKKIAQNETRGIDFDTFDKICRALDCQPADLIVYVKEDEK